MQKIHELLLDWRDAVEARNPKSIFVTEGRRSDWQRAIHPDPANKLRTWWKHVDRVVGFFQEEWNSIRQEDEEPLKLTRATFLRGPPGGAMRPIASADLQELPSLGSAGIAHLHGYLDDLRVRVEKSQALQNIVAERALRDSIVSALENLGHWSFCADEMEHLVQINEQLQDFTEVGRCLLRQGIALYRAEQFTGAKAAFEKALNISNRKLPVRADLKTQLRIRDYLGLCHLRLKKTKIALKTLQEAKAIAAKNKKIAKSHGLNSWALEATLALAQLSKTVGSGNQRRRNPMATAGAAFSRNRGQRDSKKR